MFRPDLFSGHFLGNDNHLPPQRQKERKAKAWERAKYDEKKGRGGTGGEKRERKEKEWSEGNK